jgi:hypothetical protein
MSRGGAVEFVCGVTRLALLLAADSRVTVSLFHKDK